MLRWDQFCRESAKNLHWRLPLAKRVSPRKLKNGWLPLRLHSSKNHSGIVLYGFLLPFIYA